MNFSGKVFRAVPIESPNQPDFVELIARKRDGGAHTQEEIARWVQALADHSVPDYQAAAWLMAVYWRGLNNDETTALTVAMAGSGKTLRWESRGGPCLDKHSTGGVGDKTSLVLAPLAAACGLRVPMLSGRGLGHTGGTLDKLEAIPGFRCDLAPGEFQAQVDRIGLAIAAAGPGLAPADRRLYALRDATATIAQPSLVCASILSKKLAEGLDGLVLDVKFGSGAFFQDFTEAKNLAVKLVQVSRGCGLPAVALLSSMQQPLGYAVGSALEVAESIACLRGAGPPDLWELCLALLQAMLRLAGRSTDAEQTVALADQQIRSGAALGKFREMVAAQGGDPAAVDRPEKFLPSAPLQRIIHHEGPAAWLSGADALCLGRAAAALGAARGRLDSRPDPAAGLLVHVKAGHRVAPGQPLATLFGSQPDSLPVAARLAQTAFSFSFQPVEPAPLIAHVIE